MSTTTIIGEILVVGLFTSLWLFGGFILLAGLNPSDLSTALIDNLTKLKDWSTLGVLILTILIYQFGWLMNAMSHTLIDGTFGRRIRRKVFVQYNLVYDVVRTAVYQCASVELRTDLGIDRTVVRIARSGILNFLFLTLVLMPHGGIYIKVATLTFALSIGCTLQWFARYKRYYFRMIEAYKVIKHLNQATFMGLKDNLV